MHCHDFSPNVIAELHPLLLSFPQTRKKNRQDPGKNGSTRRMLHAFAEKSSVDGVFGQSDKTRAKYFSNFHFFRSRPSWCVRFGQLQNRIMRRAFIPILIFFSLYLSPIHSGRWANLCWIIADFVCLYPCDVFRLLNLLACSLSVCDETIY